MSREEKSAESPILNLPDELLELIAGKLDSASYVKFSQVCQLFRDCASLNRLMHAVVYGAESSVIAILNRDCTLLLRTDGVATDLSGRRIQGLTPFQAALCAGDVEMCQEIMAIAKRHNMEDHLQTQFESVFLDGDLEAVTEQQKQDTFNFDAIVTAITNASDTELQAALSKEGMQLTQTDEARVKPDDHLSLTQALNRFREQFAELSRAETVFNPTHLLAAFKRYDKETVKWDWDQRNSNRRDLFWRQVVGYVQCFLPACYAQAFVQGIVYVTQNNEKLNRSFTFRSDSSTCLYPPRFDGRCGLGFDWAVGAKGRWGGCDDCLIIVLVVYGIYVSEKKRALQSIYSAAASTATPCGP